VADLARARGVRYVNHTFTTALALSASIQPYAGLADHELCEFPCQPSALARELTRERLLPVRSGRVVLPEQPGLGIEPNALAIRKYLVETEIIVGGRKIMTSPKI
jgi:L-alanine-DL-glutamate epimerase-like enolase superfamily enzyme